MEKTSRTRWLRWWHTLRHHIRRLALFGSALPDDFGPDSDVDALVEFEPGRPVGFMRLAGMEIELSEILNRRVVLHPRNREN